MKNEKRNKNGISNLYLSSNEKKINDFTQCIRFLFEGQTNEQKEKAYVYLNTYTFTITVVVVVVVVVVFVVRLPENDVRLNKYNCLTPCRERNDEKKAPFPKKREKISIRYDIRYGTVDIVFFFYVTIP